MSRPDSPMGVVDKNARRSAIPHQIEPPPEPQRGTNDHLREDQAASEGEAEKSLARIATVDHPYTSYNSRMKVIIVLVATTGGLFSPFTTNIYFPAIDIISNALHVSVSDVGLTITTYMIFQGVAPSFISAIADDYGRRPGYVVGFVVYMAANLGLALNNSYAGLLVLRALQSAGSSGLVTLGQGTIADVVTSAERGKYIALTSLAAILAPSIAPIAGGALAQHLGWHSVFWFLLILGAVYLVPLVLFFPETCRSVVGDGSLMPPKWNRSLTDIQRLKKRQHSSSIEEDNSYAEQERLKASKARGSKWDIFGPLRLCLELETAIVLLYLSIVYAGFYVVSTTITVQFHNIYNLSSTLQGLLFLPQAVGTIFASLVNSRTLDWNFKRHALKAGLEVNRKKQNDLAKMPIERARLECAMPFFIGGAISIIVYGWLLEAQVHIAGPIVLLVLIGFFVLASFNPMSVLIIDLHRSRPATAGAAANLARCLLGAGGSAVANPMIEAMGNGWAFTLVGLVELAFLPILILPIKYGIQWRAEKQDRIEAKQRELEEKRRQEEA
jgi:multidrug resistance protein